MTSNFFPPGATGCLRPVPAAEAEPGTTQVGRRTCGTQPRPPVWLDHCRVGSAHQFSKETVGRAHPTKTFPDHSSTDAHYAVFNRLPPPSGRLEVEGPQAEVSRQSDVLRLADVVALGAERVDGELPGRGDGG